ncbi:sigma factor-like helix-turn-helix DNA-binding protein [Paenibacillus dendritiformis]|uniref:sigma factor-like helix-turn-helix DNA-binding protein n=1 Tax=Paenibacillus TaxID=44249 RepID=UPI002683613A
MHGLSLYDFYKKELRRIAWRLQYRSKVTLTREGQLKLDIIKGSSFLDEADSRLFVTELINSLESPKARQIITKIYVENKSEKEIASEMNITQQGVNKWKRKSLKLLSQNSNLWS